MRRLPPPRQLLVGGLIAVVGGIWIYSHLPVNLRSTDRLISDLASLSHRFDFKEKIAIVRRLGAIRSPKAVDPLIAVLDRPWPGESFSSISLSLYEDQDDQLLSAVATALGSIGDERAVAPMLHATRYSYNDSRRHLAAQVQVAIRQIGRKSVPNLISVLTGNDKDSRCGALRELAELQDARAVPSIAGLLPEGYSGSCDMGELAAGALAGAGDAGVDALVVASRDQREGVRKRAICSLTRVQNPRAIGALVGALGEPYDYPRCGDKPLRDAALEALVGIGAPAIEPLKEAATAHSGGTRERALAALVKLNGSQSIPMLSDMLAKGGPEQQVAAAKALATSGDQGLEVLLGAVQSPRSRRAALTALGGTKSSRAVPPLIQALRSGGSEDAEQAKRSLAGLGAVSAPDVIDLLDSPSFAPVVYDIFMRGHMASEGGASLVAAHQKSVGQKHLEIARILSDIGERRADDGLWSDVRRGDLRVAVSLDSFLIRTGSPEAEGILIRALDAYGTGDMALTLLNSGNDKLEKAATNWASRHGYKVNRSNMPNFGPRWGGR